MGLNAQKWVEMMQDPNANFYRLKKNLMSIGTAVHTNGVRDTNITQMAYLLSRVYPRYGALRVQSIRRVSVFFITNPFGKQ